MRPGLTRDAECLIERHVHSVGTLDLLLLLRERPTCALSTTAICELLRCPSGWATEELGRLCAAELLVAEGGGHRYAPATARLRAAVDSAAAARQRDRAAVERLIFAPRRRIAGG